MRDWSEKLIQETKDLFGPKYGRELTREEAIECLDNMANLADLLIETYLDQKAKGHDILAKKD